MNTNADQKTKDIYWMRKAMRLASVAESAGEVPVGAVLVDDNGLISVGYNQCISLHDASAHAEMIAIRRAGRKKRNYRLVDTTLYVTLEPCPMCAGALVHSRVGRLVFGAFDPKTGAAGSVMNLCQHDQLNHKVEVQSGVLETSCSDMLTMFFRKRREIKKANKKAC